MILFKKYRERLILLEYENRILSRKIKEIEKQLKPLKPMFPQSRIIKDDNWDLSYDTLREKYRDYSIKFNDGL